VWQMLSYMHRNRFPPITLRDLSSKNVLIDSKYVAHISDCGTAKVMKSDSSNWTSFAGTFGYAAPRRLDLMSSSGPLSHGFVRPVAMSKFWTTVLDFMVSSIVENQITQLDLTFGS
ncbi:hypothetical protein C3L33_21962, partial [Rhododendron williamsianum]